jgi:uncharacterized membrane protein (DUF4010 family)
MMIPFSTTDLEIAGRLALAGLTGLAVGIEREWSGHASGPHARFAGVRTFLLLGLVGGMSGAMATVGSAAVAVTLAGGAAVLAVVAYVVASAQTADRDGTTETAALLVLGTGALCGLGYGSLGSGIAVVAALALAEKTRIQHLVARIGDIELRAALRFAVLALVVLPLLPEGPYGPYDAIRPRELWSIVLLFSGLNFLGYLARRAVGPERGYGITGLLGGLVSSTAVALSFSRESRSSPQYAVSLGLGVLAACTVLVPRVLVITLVLSPPVARHLTRYVILPVLVGSAFVAWVWLRKRDTAGGPELPEQSPLRLGTAIQMVAAFQLVLLAIPYIQRLWGAPGVLASAAVLGLTDMDALTYSMARLGGGGEAVLAARAIAVGILSNTLLKLTLVLSLGAPQFRRTAGPGLLGLGAAVLAALMIWR